MIFAIYILFYCINLIYCKTNHLLITKYDKLFQQLHNECQLAISCQQYHNILQEGLNCIYSCMSLECYMKIYETNRLGLFNLLSNL